MAHWKRVLRENFGPQDERKEQQDGYRPRVWKEQREVAKLLSAPINLVERRIDTVYPIDDQPGPVSNLPPNQPANAEVSNCPI